MPHRVEMDVVDMGGEIVFVADGAFPVAALPNAALRFCRAARWDRFGAGQAARKGGFDQAPAGGKIGIAIRQSPDCVEMVGQDNDRLDREGMPGPHIAEGGAETVDVIDQHREGAVFQVNGKEIGATGEKVAAVRGHGRRPMG